MDANERMTRSELINAVSKDADVRPDVVRDVLASFTNVAVEEIVNRGAFQLDNLLRIATAEWKGYTAGGGRKIPAHNRLSVKLSETLRALFKHHQENPDVTIDRETWREVLKGVMERRYTSQGGVRVGDPVNQSEDHSVKTTESVIGESLIGDDDFNPILDDTDE